MSTLADELQALRRGLRDLVALTTLPVVWTGRKPVDIVESLADVLLNTLSVDFVYVRVQGALGETALNQDA